MGIPRKGNEKKGPNGEKTEEKRKKRVDKKKEVWYIKVAVCKKEKQTAK